MTGAGEVVTSRQNKLCKLVRSLHSRKGRVEAGLFVAEGENAVNAALDAAWPMELLLVQGGHSEPATSALAQRARAKGIAVQAVAAEIMGYIADADSALPCMALMKLPPPPAAQLAHHARDFGGLLVLIDGVADSGNVGTLVRTADAVGAGAIGLTTGSADLYSPKTVRATAGSVFRVAARDQLADSDWATYCLAGGLPVVVADAHGGADCFAFDWPARCALVLGHETRGISAELARVAGACVTIPMRGRAESLNVAAAGAVLLFAWQQAQRAHLT